MTGGVTFILAVVLLFLMSWRRCAFRCESESTMFGLPNEVHNQKSVVKLYLQHCSRTDQRKYLSVFSVFYGGDSQPVSMFRYLKNLLLTIQTRVLSSVE